MHNLNLSSQQALDAIGVSASEREKYLKMLSEVTSQKQDESSLDLSYG
jgi:hypothetical protein